MAGLGRDTATSLLRLWIRALLVLSGLRMRVSEWRKCGIGGQKALGVVGSGAGAAAVGAEAGGEAEGKEGGEEVDRWLRLVTGTGSVLRSLKQDPPWRDSGGARVMEGEKWSCSAINYRRSTHGRGRRERICS